MLCCRDLYGAVGFPRCVARTVVVGRDALLIEKILWVLSYFIRCSELAENNVTSPLLTANIDDTTTLMSASDIATPVGCLAADVTLSTSVSTLATVKSETSVEKPQFFVNDSSPAFVLKPAPLSSGHGARVRFDSKTPQCSVNTSSSTDQNPSSTVASDCTEVDRSVETTPTVPLNTDGDLVPRPRLFFRADVSDVLPPLSGVTCFDCSYSQPCQECSKNISRYLKSKDNVHKDGENVPLVSTHAASDVRSTSSVRTSIRTNCEENMPSSSLPKPCQLSPIQANENVRIERVAHVGGDLVQQPQPKLGRVLLDKPNVSSLDFGDGSADLPVLISEDHTAIKSSRVPRYQRGDSMFDEYFEDSSSSTLIDLFIGGSGDAFDEIMNEPCPDVSHITVSQRSSGSSSSSSEMMCSSQLDHKMFPTLNSPSDGTVPPSSGLPRGIPDPTAVGTTVPLTFDNFFNERHFAVENNKQHLDDIPDGPSKQMIRGAIKLMQDVCLDHSSHVAVDDLPASDYFSQPGLGPSRGRQRHPSGQSITSARCR